MPAVPLLDLKLQYATLRDEIDRAIAEVVASQGFVLGPVVERLEQEISRFVGTEHAVGCASGTDALILALAALDIGPGDEVLTSPFSFFATASCAYKVGARPRFADIDPQTFNLDPSSVAERIGPRTRALLPVHLFGQCAAMDSLNEIGEQHGIPVVEDAAQALSATYRSATRGELRAGGVGRIGCYSFFPTKNLGGFGDGGMIVTSDGPLADKLRLLRVHGGRQMYEHQFVGWNSRLDALQAAVLRVKLPHLDAWCWSRRDGYACPTGTRPRRTSSTSTPYASSGAISYSRISARATWGTVSTIPSRCTCRSASRSWATRKGVCLTPSRPAARWSRSRSSRS
jgi:dTDP-4-amino-4,6-dideoxygalactose transaminase